MEHIIRLYSYIDGINDIPFPSEAEQVTITSFKYEANRMAGAPTITATVKHRLCLDDLWTDNVYGTFNGEKYFIRNVPSSSKSNDDTRYEHSVELLSEREILNHVYFIDAVQGDSTEDVYKTNTTKFQFMGNIHEFANRLNASLQYSNLDYSVVVDSGISSEDKLVSFEDKYILEAMQEIFNTYEIPYYFVGKVIHIGYTDNAITHVFKYGHDEALLKINKNNANYQVINRITAVGSSDNIPYYYPNESDDRAAIIASGKKWITPSQNLMPPIYRETNGAERFYNAKNNTYSDGEGGYYHFNNEYTPNNPLEGKQTFEDIKPTIKGMTNANGERIDMFMEFAYDRDDSDEVDEEGNYIHPYFFAKLRKTNGANGFNLFEHAIESQAMQISMTSGDCGACTFEIGVGEETQQNIVQVDENGDLLRDDDGNVVRSGTPQPQQNDTENYEVWLALKKDDSTYSTLMPDALLKLRPSTNDTFVILGISLPQGYITRAEEELMKSMIKYMYMNNDEKFTFSISFSRIFFTEHPDILSQLNENARLLIEYNGKQHTLYVNSFNYTMSESQPLPEIQVDLVDTLTIGQNTLQTALDSVKQDILSQVRDTDFLRQGLKYFLRKDVADKANGKIIFSKGAEFGKFIQGLLGTGGAISIDNDGNSHAEFDYITVRKIATFIELVIQEAKSVGGMFIVSPCNMKVTRVEETDTAYRCYFDNTDGDKTITSQFEVGDQARRQTFNLTTGQAYYWRLVTEVGSNYIDLSKTDCDTGSTAPQEGDELVSLGNRNDVTRQSAIVIAAYGTGSPSIMYYQGINSYSLVGKMKKGDYYDVSTGRFKTVTYGDSYVGAEDESTYMKYDQDNGVEIKGKVNIEAGSTGANNLIDLPDEIQNAVKIGGENLLLNTGFVGDYETINVQSSSVLKNDTEMYSPSLNKWEGNATVSNDSEAISGCSCTVGAISQACILIPNENYVISYKAKGTSLNISCGGNNITQELNGEYKRYVHKFIYVSGNIFLLSGNATICDLKLERGTVATDWCPSVLDPDTVSDKFKGLWYLQDALKGSTDILGGLILSTMIQLGKWQDGAMKKVTAGMSGIYNDDDDVYTWGGGTFEQAIKTVMRYKNDPTYEPTDTELADMAKSVITHGGRAILNDVILRGYIYALGGVFRGAVHATSGEFEGSDNKGFRISVNADNKKIMIWGPDKVKTDSSDDFIPTDDAKSYMYITIGDFTYTVIRGVGEAPAHAMICPQIKIENPLSDNGGEYISLDSYNGLVTGTYTIESNGKKQYTPRSIYSRNASIDGFLNIENLPTSRDNAIPNQVYRDGETLKIRIDE